MTNPFSSKSSALILTLCLLAFFLISCQPKSKQNYLSFTPKLGEVSLNCKQMLNLGDEEWQLDELQFFIAELKGLDQQGKWQTIAMANTSYQSDSVALLGQQCGSEDTGNWKIELLNTEALTQYQRIKFTLGVPFELNHLNPLEQSSPLNMPSMFWVWRTGHKFIRLEMSSRSDAWVFHLGSTGCAAVSPVRSPESPCSNPNQVEIDLPMPNNQIITLDIKQLIDGIDLGEQTSCQSAPDNNHCQVLFNRIGITGEQQVFGVRREG